MATGIPVTPGVAILVEFDDGGHEVVVPLSDRLWGMVALRRDEDGTPQVVTRRVVKVVK